MSRILWWPVLGLGVWMVMGPSPAQAQMDDATMQEYRAAYPEWFAVPGKGRVRPMDIPDIFGPGAVLDVGNIYMKVTNYAVIGNAFPALSSDPSGQWPGSSGIEYLTFILLGVGGVNSTATDPAAIRRVSLQAEWRPQTLEPVDRMYRSYDGQVNSMRQADDDQDARSHDPLVASQYVDEDFQDGRDNAGDGLIDEDFAAYGQKMWSCVMWDNTLQAFQTTFNERHVPLVLECRQTAWAYSVPGYQDFNIIRWEVFNRSGHGLDSMYVGIRWDLDAGPLDNPGFRNDDYDIPFFPHGDFTVPLGSGKWGDRMDPKGYRRQDSHAEIPGVSNDSALCPRVTLRVNGFSVADDDGDEGRTTGIPSILLLGHTVDPKGLLAPPAVGWHGFRSFLAGQPYSAGGNPATDAQRFEMFESTAGIDPETGFINAQPVDQQGEVQGWAMVGPFGNADASGARHPIPDGGSIEVTIAFAVQRGDNRTVNQFPADYQRYLDGGLTASDLFVRYPALENAFAAQVAYEGVYDNPPPELADDMHINTPDFHGRETRVIAPKGYILSGSDCRDEGSQRTINEFGFTWFDYDCNYCTGVWVFGSGTGGGSGKILRRWNTAAPPPNPNVNVQSSYNFAANPDRRVAPAGDGTVTLGWDNLSEVTVDPEKGHFDFRSYRVWKAANWLRPVGSSGPADADWALLGDFRLFDYYTLAGEPVTSNRELFTDAVMTARGFTAPAFDSVHAGVAVCPQISIPNLSLQTIVLDKRRFASASEAADWVRTHGYRYENNLSEDATSWRFRQADGECMSETMHTVGLEDSTVFAEACVNPLAPTRGFRVPICLDQNDLWNRQSGTVVRPTPDRCPARAADGTCLTDTIPCLKDGLDCHRERGKLVDRDDIILTKTRYTIGRYQLVDREVKDGFTYFYAVTAGDSSSNGTIDTRDDELVGRRSAVEADAVVPQASARTTKSVWVVPNPYRGYSDIHRRSSAWDLTPNATDPTGTHIDFLGMPLGRWTLSIFTVSGDLVQVLHSTDEVNESLRGPAVVRNPNFNPNLPVDPTLNPEAISVPGFNRQQDNPNDGQARWNLITRSGQDIVSGIYLFVVESDLGTQRGRFVVIR